MIQLRELCSQTPGISSFSDALENFGILVDGKSRGDQ